MQRAGMSCDFVGHPVVTEPIATDEEAAAFRDEFRDWGCATSADLAWIAQQ